MTLGFATAAAVALLVAVVYWPARRNGFVWDDWLPLVDTPVFRDPARWLEAMLTPPLNNPVAIRPLAMLTFMVQLWSGHAEPGPFHLVNIAIHAATSFVVVFVALQLAVRCGLGHGALAAAAIAGLIYGLHPALTEPVLWISCRYDLLMAFFLSTALLSDQLLSDRGWTQACAVGAGFLAAALSKETALGFAFALPFVHVAADQLRGIEPSRLAFIRIVSCQWRVYGAVIGAGLLYLGVRASITGSTLGMDRMADQFYDVGALSQRLLAVAATFGTLVTEALWPFKASVPSRSLILPLEWADAIPFLPALMTLAAVVILSRRADGAGRALLALFLAFCAALLPVSNLFPLPGLFGELWTAARYLTFPLVLLCLAVPLAFHVVAQQLRPHAAWSGKALACLALIWLVASMALVRATIPLWKDDGSLNAWAIRNGARNYWRYHNLGDYYLKTGRADLARDAFSTAVQLRGDIPHNWSSLGFAEAQLGNTDQARTALASALHINPDLIIARITLAKVELREGNVMLAARVLEEGEPRLQHADDKSQLGAFHYLLGITYAKLGRRKDAAGHLTQALELANGEAERRSARAALESMEAADR